MSQHNERKQRTCKHCKGPIYATAKELKEHAMHCMTAYERAKMERKRKVA